MTGFMQGGEQRACVDFLPHRPETGNDRGLRQGYVFEEPRRQPGSRIGASRRGRPAGSLGRAPGRALGFVQLLSGAL